MRHRRPPPAHPLADHLRERVLVLDGAMGTMIQRAGSARPTSAASASATTRATCAARTTCWR
jgi:methionine synthase I (cobalamin-dependent)